MSTFGEKLRHERESRDTTIAQIAATTKIQRRYLEALEQGDLDVLPGHAFGKFYIRAYADVLGFDPQQLIVDYDDELRARRRGELDALRGPGGGETKSPAAAPAVAPPINDERQKIVGALEAAMAQKTPQRGAPPAPNRLAIAGAGLLLVVAAIYMVFFRGGDATPVEPAGDAAATAPAGEPAAVTQAPPVEPADAAETTPVETAPPAIDEAESKPAEPPVVEPEPPQRQAATKPVETTPLPAPTETPPAPTTASRLEVPDFGVGRRVANRQLQDRTEVFVEGEAATFWTRVVGGTSGDSIRHVWLRDGKPVQTIRLRVGASHWRTHSRKTLWGAGQWAVEARDADGNVLARAAFFCNPR
ncbi:MAG: DUF2914 domain-containing protein [bacterium]|nr:DUF2914 domain-containing protein [bacterium]